MASGGVRYVPESREYVERDTEYAARFAALASVLDTCPHSEDVAVLLSTCRNHFLAVNAVFVDLRFALGATDLPAPLARVIYELARGSFARARDQLGRTREVLAASAAKIQVWHHREELHDEYTVAVGALPDIDRDRIESILQAHHAHAVQSAYLAYDRSEQVSLAGIWQTLCSIQDRLVAVADMCAALLALNERPRDPTLFEAPLAPQQAIDKVVGALAKLVKQHPMWWGAQVVDDRVLFGSGETLVQLAPSQVRVEDVAILTATSCKECSRLLADAARDLSTTFRPNVAEKPMPDPFVVDLTANPRIPDGRSTFEVVEVPCAGEGEEEQPTVALLKCGVPTSWYDETRHFEYRRGGSNYAIRISQLARGAVRVAKEHGAKLLAMPEAFLPREVVAEIQEQAHELGVVVVAGVELHLRNDKVANEVLVALPTSVAPSWQRKQRPSVYEVWEENFASDGKLLVFDRSPIGRFAVVVCSDYLEMDLVSTLALHDQLEAVIVCARNPHPHVFEALAIADAARLYANIIVVNAHPGDSTSAASGDGTFCAAPLRTGPIVEMTEVPLSSAEDWPEGPLPTLAIGRIPVGAVRRRHYRRQEPNYLAAPRFVRPIGPE